MPAPVKAALRYFVASTVIHCGYYFFLIAASKNIDHSVALPIARGAAPVLIALGATIWPGEILSLMAWGGIIGVSCGVALLVVSRATGAVTKALFPAFITALMVAAYSIVDGVGVRVAGSPLSYITWRFTAEICVTLFVLMPRRALIRQNGVKQFLTGFSGGVLSSLSYALAVFAQTLAPLALVAAIRETSVILAALIGVIWFKERPVLMRICAACVVAFGVILIALS